MFTCHLNALMMSQPLNVFRVTFNLSSKILRALLSTQYTVHDSHLLEGADEALILLAPDMRKLAVLNLCIPPRLRLKGVPSVAKRVAARFSDQLVVICPDRVRRVCGMGDCFGPISKLK